MQIERWGPDVRLADHHMHLAAVMRLMVEKMKHSDWRCIEAIFALVIGVGKLPTEKIFIDLGEELFDFPVLCGSRRAKLGKAIEQNGIQWWCRIAPSREPRHPDAIPKQNMIQQTGNAAEGTTALLSILNRVQLAALLVESLIRDAVVAGQHLESIKHQSIES
jgi:hypothetical protein